MSDLEDRIRAMLLCLTARISNERVQGIVFAAGLVVSDHVFKAVYAVYDGFET